jgi:hypothetical protein
MDDESPPHELAFTLGIEMSKAGIAAVADRGLRDVLQNTYDSMQGNNRKKFPWADLATATFKILTPVLLP